MNNHATRSIFRRFLPIRFRQLLRLALLDADDFSAQLEHH